MTPNSAPLTYLRWPALIAALTVIFWLWLLADHALLQPDSWSLLILDSLPLLIWSGLLVTAIRVDTPDVRFSLVLGLSLLYLAALITSGRHFIPIPAALSYLAAILQAAGSITLALGMFKLIKQLTEHSQLLSALASANPLASLANSRNTAQPRSTAGLERKAALLVIGIDDFALLKTARGQVCCDFQLIKLAELIANLIRKQDRVVRWGGEEFIIELGGADLNTARVKAEHLRMTIAEYPFYFAGQPLRITVSIGIAQYDGMLANRKLALLAAKTTMGQAARQGGNRVQVHQSASDPLNESATTQSNLSSSHSSGSKPH
ncbi:GGDEF domain-containing protein [Shewanella sp. GXUN23E]|uniref:GGDEF domain-containing protein n=1 Tax=Shewanella sp. GXUN23E TaxID=3422498 RepID=UPI003D7C9E86